MSKRIITIIAIVIILISVFFYTQYHKISIVLKGIFNSMNDNGTIDLIAFSFIILFCAIGFAIPTERILHYLCRKWLWKGMDEENRYEYIKVAKW